jgi:hypothetical protein
MTLAQQQQKAGLPTLNFSKLKQPFDGNLLALHAKQMRRMLT